MKLQTFTLIAFLLCAYITQAQLYMQYFEGGTPFEEISVQIDTTDTQNVWQIGKPQKTIFDAAATVPNAIVTDTLNPYPPNDTSSFELEIPLFVWGLNGVFAMQWSQKLDLGTGDLGVLEYSFGDSVWTNAFDDPNVYNFYGYEAANKDTLPDGTVGFSGTDSLWRDVWFCLDASWLISQSSNLLHLRYTILSDTVDNPHEGWMMDNMQAHLTLVHTIAEHESSEYMKVYPTMTSGRVFLEAQKQDGYHIIEHMELYSLDGKLVKQYGQAPTKYFIDLDDLPNGVYVLKVTTNLKSESHRLVLEK